MRLIKRVFFALPNSLTVVDCTHGNVNDNFGVPGWLRAPVVLTADSHGTIETIPFLSTYIDSPSRSIQSEHVEQLLAIHRNPCEWNTRHDIKFARENDSKSKFKD